MVVSPLMSVAQSGPVAGDDWVWVDVSQAAVVDVLGNDYDPNEDFDSASLGISRQPNAGTAAVAETADGRAVIENVAAATGGSDSLAYEICDALNQCATAEVTVMVGTTGCTIVGTEGTEAGDADGAVSTGRIAARLDKSHSGLGPCRDQLIRRGLIYAPGRGLVAFSVPGMGAFVNSLSG